MKFNANKLKSELAYPNLSFVLQSLQNGESEEVLILKCKLKTQERLLHQAISRLEATNKMKEGIEGEVIKRLTR